MAKSKSHPVPEPPGSPTQPGYVVVARRYRPQQLADLVGQEHVATALKNAITSGRIAHAYLFTGPRGIGKTSTARILAKALNCVHGPTPTPCDQCSNCLSIISGDDVDVIEIDGASNNGVDDARELRGNVGFLPQHSRFKIYIIDEVHMLSVAAFNALLKTLEEPPPHVKFIFATTEVHKLPITILSRCQRFDFAAVTTQRVFATLQHIVKKEGLSADDEALQILARRSGGSMRDSQTLLDQVLGVAAGQTITAQLVHELLGSSQEERVLVLADAILRRDAKAALDELNQAVAKGLQLTELLDQLTEYWRGLMLMNVGGEAAVGVDLPPQWLAAIAQQAPQLPLDTILAGLDILGSTKAKLRQSAHAQVLVEVAVVRLARLEELVSITALVQTLAQGGPVAVPAASKPALPADVVKKNSLTNGVSQAARAPEAKPPASAPEAGSAATLWPTLVASLGPFLRSNLQPPVDAAILGPKLLAIRFPASYTGAYDICSSEESRETLQHALKRLTNEEWSIRLEKVADDPSTTEALPLMSTAADRKKDLEQLPFFKRLKERFNADLVKVQDGFNPVAAPAATPAPSTNLDDDPEAQPAPPTPEED